MGVVIARRVLDLLSNLAKSDTRAALSLVMLPVPMPWVLRQHIAQQAARATKGKAKADEPSGGALTAPLAELPGSLPAVQVLLGMLGRPFCSRSNLHLELVLALLEGGLSAAQTRVKDLVAKEGALKAEGPAEGAAAEGGAQGAATAGTCVFDMAHVLTNDTAPMDVGEGGEGGSPPQPATPTDVAESLPDPRPALAAVPTDLLRLLPSLHSTQRLSDSAQKKCAALLRSFCAVLPHQQAYMLSVLADEAVRLGRHAAADIASDAHPAGSPLATSATQAMCVMLALCTLTGLQSDQTQPLAAPSQEEQVLIVGIHCTSSCISCIAGCHCHKSHGAGPRGQRPGAPVAGPVP